MVSRYKIGERSRETMREGCECELVISLSVVSCQLSMSRNTKPI